MDSSQLPTWEYLQNLANETTYGQFYHQQLALREKGEGLPHTDAKIRLFGSTEEPRVTLFRDTAAWCPYCQKVK